MQIFRCGSYRESVVHTGVHSRKLHFFLLLLLSVSQQRRGGSGKFPIALSRPRYVIPFFLPRVIPWFVSDRCIGFGEKAGYISLQSQLFFRTPPPPWRQIVRQSQILRISKRAAHLKRKAYLRRRHTSPGIDIYLLYSRGEGRNSHTEHAKHGERILSHK